MRVQAGDDPQLHPLRAARRAGRDPRGRAHASPSRRTRRGRTKSCFKAIAAAVIGGTLLPGGSGTVVGALIGALFLGRAARRPDPQGRQRRLPGLFYLGLAIILAMTINVYVQRVRGGVPGAWLSSRVPAEHDRRRGRRRRRPDDVLRVEHIAKRFGPVTALRDVNLHLQARARCSACSATTAPASRR